MSRIPPLTSYGLRKTLNSFVRQSCGQFIYAVTILKFVGAVRRTKQLEAILESDPTMFPDLDQVYDHILSVFNFFNF
jgi:hypothetical protein